jgi:flagellar basal-body rod protein FlgG
MNNVFYIGATGLNAQQNAVDITANNLANMNTAAYKRGIVSFSELLVGGRQQVSAARSTYDIDAAAVAPAGVEVNSSLHAFTPGTLHATNNALDLAIKGDGFIELGADASTGDAMLWRGGTLHVGTDGFLAAPNGQPLKAMISVPRDATAITVGTDGQVQATVPGQTDPLDIGQIELVTVEDTRALRADGDAVYRVADDGAALTRAKPGEENAGSLVQGYAEGSNVSLSDELVNLMLYQRAYAANARLVQVGDELMSIANGLKR